MAADGAAQAVVSSMHAVVAGIMGQLVMAEGALREECPKGIRTSDLLGASDRDNDLLGLSSSWAIHWIFRPASSAGHIGCCWPAAKAAAIAGKESTFIMQTVLCVSLPTAYISCSWSDLVCCCFHFVSVATIILPVLCYFKLL
jgi:hypothetical protein